MNDADIEDRLYEVMAEVQAMVISVETYEDDAMSEVCRQGSAKVERALYEILDHLADKQMDEIVALVKTRALKQTGHKA